jgi:hypothetical protein
MLLLDMLNYCCLYACHAVAAGIIGALDPYTHKVNTASLSGEGKLELEGVRPLRTNTAAVANIAASIMAGGQSLQQG